MRRGWICAALAVALAGCGGGSKRDDEPPPRRTPTATPKPKTTAAAVASRSHVPVLCYHQIRTPTAADSAADRQYIVRPSVLEKQMQALADAGYTPISGEDYVAHMARGAKLPRKPILLTFDDASGRPVHAGAADPAQAPLQGDLLRHDRRARQAGLDDARARCARSTAPG